MRFVDMKSPVKGGLPPLYRSLLLLPWWTLQEMRARLPEGTVLGHWTGPDREKPDAAFLAVTPDKKTVLSAVSLGASAVVRWDGAKVTVDGKAPERPVTSLDIEGAAVEPAWVVLFHTEAVLARSVLSFEVKDKAETLRFVVTGLAAGDWEIWRNGWSAGTVEVKPREGVLYFEGRPGSYFLRPQA
jgi:hypothetical protein